MLTLQSHVKNIAKYPIPLTLQELNAANNGSKVLINSLPKSGTFLLRRALSLLPNFASRWSIHGLVADRPNLEREIEQIRGGQYGSGHLYWSTGLTQLLNVNNIRTIFVMRDLRDVAVSLAFYLNRKTSGHQLYSYFVSLESDDARIMAVIRGAEQKLYHDCNRPKSLGDFAQSFASWTNEPNCLVVRFEDLIGTSGGGSEQQQQATMRSIANYLNIELSEAEIIRLSKKLFFKRSTTFRRGQIGDWQNWFTVKHKRVFKDLVGRSLIEFGYETEYDW